MSNERGIAGHATVTARGHFVDRRRGGCRECPAGAADHAAHRTGRAPSPHLRHQRAGRGCPSGRRPGRAGAGGRVQCGARRRPRRSDRRAARQHRNLRGRRRRAGRGRGGVGRRRRRLAGHGFGGLECLSGIPGSAGATPVQNVGAYGAEVADTIRRVRLLDRDTGEDRWLSPDILQFGYRTSILKNSSTSVVLEVEFALDPAGRSAPLRYGELAAALDAEPGQRADPARVRAAVLSLRAAKAWCSTRTITTRGASGRSSPTRWCHRADFERLAGAVDEAGPEVSRGGRGEAGRGVARRAGRVRQGLSRGRGTGPAVDQARPRCDQSG